MQLTRFACVALLSSATLLCPLSRPAKAQNTPTQNAQVQSAKVQNVPPSLAVLGVACPVKDKEWRDGLVGFGIGNLVAQAFYNSGKVRLIEEKPQVLATLRPELPAQAEQALNAKSDNLAAIARAMNVDMIAFGNVSAEFSRASGGFVGPFSTQSRETTVKVRLRLFDARTGKNTTAEGKGKVGRSSSAWLADFGRNGLPFDPSTVAPASWQAAQAAVSKLLPNARVVFAPLRVPSQPLVIGVERLALKPEVAALYPVLRAERVTMGVHSRVMRAVSDTPNCRLQEIEPEVLRALELQYWVRTTGAPDAATAPASPPARDLTTPVKWLVYGEVFSFSIRPVEKLRGFSGRVSSEARLGVQLRAIDLSSPLPRYFTASGVGVAQGDWSAYTGREEDFQSTLVGRASQSAINQAWPQLARAMSANS